MEQSVELFEKDKYVCIKNLVDKNSCLELSNYLKKAVEDKRTTKDPQCPLSESLYGGEIFDRLLENLMPMIEQNTGKKLYPTYSYARLYKPDEELKNHRDRDACEISVSLCLDFEGDSWPIYISHNQDKSNASEIIMEQGDAVIYRGCDVWHWRDKFKGKWATQVFLHYVDKNGPHKEWRFDKREKLGVPKDQINKNENGVLPDYTLYYDHLSPKFCDMIVEEYKKDIHTKEPPYIGGLEGDRIDRSIREVDRLILDVTKGVSATMASAAIVSNNLYWKYAIDEPFQSEFLLYKPGGQYKAHIDTFHQHTNQTRKLTVLAFLNDDFEGGRFFLNANGNITYPHQSKGTIIIFPSFVLHGVEPVTKGVRYSVVTWLVGPYFK